MSIVFTNNWPEWESPLIKPQTIVAPVIGTSKDIEVQEEDDSNLSICPYCSKKSFEIGSVVSFCNNCGYPANVKYL